MQSRLVYSRQKVVEIIYKFFLTVFIVIELLGSTYARSLLWIDLYEWNIFVKWGIPFLLFLLYLLEAKVTGIKNKEFWVELGVIFLLLVNFIFAHNSTIFVSILFMITYPKTLDSKKIAKYISIVFAIFITYILINCFCGILPDISMFRTFTESYRHSLGFVSPNALGNTVTVCLMMFFYSKIDNWKLVNTITFTITLIILYMYVINRMGVAIILIMILMGIFYKKIRTWKILNILYFCSSWLFPVLFIVTYVIINYMRSHMNTEMYILGNLIFSTRIWWCIYYWDTYGFSIFGQKIETVGIYEVMTKGGTWMGLDNSYLMIPIQFGIVFLVLFCIGYYILGKRLRANRDIAGAFITVLFLIYGITENYLFSIHYNFSMILLAYELFVRKRKYYITKV